MTSEAPYLHCRLCGARYRSDKVDDHEKHCLYKTPNSRDALNKERRPSSKDSRVNEIRDTEEYYREASRSSVNQPDPKSNEESIDSPLNMNRSGAKLYRNKPTESNSRSKARNTVSPKDDGINELREQSERSPKSTVNQAKDPKSSEESVNSPSSPNRRSARASGEYPDEPTVNQSRSGSVAWEIPSDDVSSAVGQSEGKSSPPKMSSNSGGKSSYHQKSHSNENTPVKVNQGKGVASPQKSDEEQKEEMMRTPYPSEEDIHIPPINSDELDEAADFMENLPELTEQSEMAYERHQRSLVPCTHCERTFRPDRLPAHERSCVDRPKTRKYIVPEDKDKKKPK